MLLLWLADLFEQFMSPRSPCGVANIRDGPLRDCHRSSWEQSNGDSVKFACVQWNGIQDASDLPLHEGLVVLGRPGIDNWG